jgi:hypothetical protein
LPPGVSPAGCHLPASGEGLSVQAATADFWVEPW